jgi:glutamate-1-semialdehyde 2,1-aminomutase
MSRTNSDAFFDFAKRYTPCGTQTLSKAPDRYVNGVYPKVIDSGKGSILFDVDNTSYIDYIAALGPIILGYAYEKVDWAVLQQMKQGVLFSLPSPLEGDVAFGLSRLVTYPSMWKFTKTGSDACSMAVKIARAYTKREKVVACGYHGWHDWFSIVNDKKAGIPVTLDSLIKKAVYNDLGSFLKLIDDDTACVIMEPQIFDTPQDGFLAGVQEACRQKGALFILDETVTGFRYPKMLAQNYFNIQPDVTIVGKASGNGYPFAAVGGKTAVMKTAERDDFFASTTFGGDCVGLAACRAVLNELPSFLDDMVSYGTDLAALFNQVMEGKATCKGFPTRTMFDFPTTEHKALFWQEACKRGVLFGYSNFIMASHLQDGIWERTAEAVREAGKTVLANWNDPKSKLEGGVPKEVFRLLRR